jgi:hypothetical protein
VDSVTDNPCPTCVKHQNKQSLDDVSADCFPCIWAHKKTGVWTHYEPAPFIVRGEMIVRDEMKELELVPMDNQTKPLDTQVGGGHYKKLPIQPVEYCHKNGMGYCESNVIKYISRWKDKGGKQDLEKVKHYVDLLIQLEGL